GIDRDGSVALRSGCISAEGWAVATFAGCDQFRARRGCLCIAVAARRRSVRAGRSQTAGGPDGIAEPARDGGVLLPRQRAASERYRRPPGNQSQDGGYVPRQPDAQAERPRPGRSGQVRDRTQPDDDFRSEVNSTHGATVTDWEFRYFSSDAISSSTASRRS